MKDTIIKVGIISLIIFAISKILGGTILVSSFLAISLPLLVALSKTKGKKNIIGIIGGLLIISIDLFLLILLIVPTKSYKIDIEDYYKKKENYAKIFFKDNKSSAKYLSVVIKNNNDNSKKIIYVRTYIKNEKKEKIKLKEGDRISFYCAKKKYCKTYKSFLAIYLWDDSILRITPGTTISLDKITKNLNNLSNSKTKIGVEKGNLWFHVIRLIKDSNSMQIETGKGQTLIIRGTSGFINKEKDKTYAIDYSHFIEIKNQKKSVLLKQGEGAKIDDENIDILNIDEILDNIGINEDFLKTLDNLDKLDINNSLKNLNNYLRSFQTEGILGNLEKLKLKTFSLGNTDYKRYLENFQNYNYLIGETKNFTKGLIENPNLAFLASNLEKTEVKIGYLYNELQKNVKNSDIYKTYIINMGIDGKVKDVRKKLEQYLNNPEIDNIIENTDKNVNDLLDDFNF